MARQNKRSAIVVVIYVKTKCSSDVAIRQLKRFTAVALWAEKRQQCRLSVSRCIDSTTSIKRARLTQDGGVVRASIRVLVIQRLVPPGASQKSGWVYIKDVNLGIRLQCRRVFDGDSIGQVIATG